MNKMDNKKGFTIIEVVLVLAIAALLILMVFIAWPALQRSAKDNQRKEDVGALGTIVGTWRSDHRGVSPTIAQLRTAAGNRGLNIYDTGDKGIVGKSITKETTLAAVSKDGTGNTEPQFNEIPLDKVIYVQSAKCKYDKTSGSASLTKSSNRSAALVYAVSGSGNTPVAQCLDA